MAAARAPTAAGMCLQPGEPWSHDSSGPLRRKWRRQKHEYSEALRGVNMWRWVSSANTSWFGFHANVPDGLGPSVGQQERLKVLTAEAACLKTCVLLFCVIERVCDTQTPPARHSLQVKSNNGNYLLYLSEKDCLQLSTKGTSRFPGDGTRVTVCRLPTALNFHAFTRFEVVFGGCFDRNLRSFDV